MLSRLHHYLFIAACLLLLGCPPPEENRSGHVEQITRYWSTANGQYSEVVILFRDGSRRELWFYGKRNSELNNSGIRAGQEVSVDYYDALSVITSQEVAPEK